MDRNEIRQLLSTYSVTPKKALGQNFLINNDISEQIADACRLTEHSLAVEVGPGLGSLTHKLAERAGEVVAIELDRELYELLSAELADTPNVTLVNSDAMAVDYAALVQQFAPLEPVFCSNLPYQITTPFVTQLCRSRVFDHACVMVQKEAAQRLCASAGDPQYNESSVYSQYNYAAELLFDVPASNFIPQPHVTSTVVSLTRTPLPEQLDEKLFLRLVRASFSARRKMLASNLSRSFGRKPADWQQFLEANGVAANARAENVSPSGFVALTLAMQSLEL